MTAKQHLIVRAVARSSAYCNFSLAFGHPDPGLVTMLEERCLPELREALSAIPHAAGVPPVPLAVPAWSADIEAGYIATFDAGAPEPPCPPYEGVYRQGTERTKILLEISGFYRHFGLAMGERRPEAFDHLRAELEFMHYLTLLEGEALQRGRNEHAEGYRLAQKDFLRRHLAAWIPAFASRVREHAEYIYPSLAGSLESFICAEEAALDDA